MASAFIAGVAASLDGAAKSQEDPPGRTGCDEEPGSWQG
jgi:hypothetical protein